MNAQAGVDMAPAEAFKDWYQGWDDGVARNMLTPGASGYGLMVWNMPLFGCREESDRTSDLSDGFYTMVPTAWECAYNADGSLIEDVLSELLDYGESMGEEEVDLLMSIPWVKVRGLRYPDDQYSGFTMQYNVAVYSSVRTTGWFAPSLDGLVPLWSIVPIEPGYYQQWAHDFVHMWRDYSWGLEHTDIPLCGHAYDEHDNFCDKRSEDDSCDSAENPDCEFNSVIASISVLADEQFEHETYMMEPDTFQDIFRYALDRYNQGWYTAIWRALNGDECSSLLSQHFSPYSVSNSSLDSLRRPEPQRSIA